MLGAVSGGSIYFATPDALSGGLLPLLQQTRPTFFFGVPRVWEKIMDAMKAKGAAGSETQKKIAAAAKAVVAQAGPRKKRAVAKALEEE